MAIVAVMGVLSNSCQSLLILIRQVELTLTHPADKKCHSKNPFTDNDQPPADSDWEVEEDVAVDIMTLKKIPIKCA